MHAPFARRRWAFDYANVVSYAGTTLATNRALLLGLVAGLLAIPGVTVHYSSDGATAGAAGDGVNRWADASDLVWANAGTAHSWIVLSLPPGLRYASPATAYLIIDLNFASASGSLGTVLLAASVSGGSLTARPTGTQEVAINTATGTANSILMPTAASGYTWHLQWAVVDPLTSGGATSVSAIRAFIIDDATGTACTVVIVEKPGDSMTGGVRDALVGGWQTNTVGDNALSALEASTTGLLRYYDGAAVDIGVVLRTFDGNFIEEGWGVSLDEDGRRVVYPIDLVTLTGPNTVVGRLTDLYYTDGAVMYTLSPAGAAATDRAWITFGRLLAPHPAGTNPTTSALEIDTAVFGEAPIGATLASLDPVSGTSLGATRDEARWLVVEVVATIGGAGVVPLVWGYFGADPGVRHVIYDGSAFTPFFEDGSTVTRTGDVYTFRLLPLGGWWDSPTIKVGAWMEAT